MKDVHGIWLPDGDTHFENHLRQSPIVYGGKTYQYAKYTKALLYVPKRALAIDVGGHVGLWSRVMAKDFLHVIAFEPLSAHRDCFLQNVTAENVELYPWAVGAQQGKVFVDMPFDNTGHSQVSEAGKGEQVDMIQLDEFDFPCRIDFLKVDVEGFEYNVVKGAEETIRTHKPTIIIEQKPNGNAETFGFAQHAAVDLLKSWGAREVAVMAGDHILVW